MLMTSGAVRRRWTLLLVGTALAGPAAAQEVRAPAGTGPTTQVSPTAGPTAPEAATSQAAPAPIADDVVVTGIRRSLRSALAEKRGADNLVEVIRAEDIGKLPDQNLAEVLENVTGVQITRTAGVGTAVQIRGTDANRTEINGVSTVSSGADRSGISFEDCPPR